MKTQFSSSRSICVAALALAIAAGLFRPQLAQALVARGDQFLVRGKIERAKTFYARAAMIDSNSNLAVDRLTFTDAQQRTAASLSACASAATAFLSKHGADPSILEDRALCHLLAGTLRLARADFANAARVSNGEERARDLVFAGWCAYRSGSRATGAAFWRAALRSRPGYLPAARALAEHKP